jgi:hypothetical protein
MFNVVDNKDIPVPEAIDVIANFLSLVISVIVVAFNFSENASLPSS